MGWVMNHQGLEIYYEKHGEGTPIVFQSGYMGIHDLWKYVVEKLSNRYMCLTHDNRGFGMSGKPEHPSYYTMEQNADDLKTVIDAAGIEEPVLIATHSIGASIAFAFALKYPEQVKGIITAGGAAMPETLQQNGNEEMWSAYQTTPSASVDFYKELGLEEAIAREAAKWTHNAFTKQIKAVLNFRLTEDMMRSIVMPVKVVQSVSDGVVPTEQAEEIANKLPNAELKLIDGCGYFPPTEKPDAVAEEIAEFCNRLM